MAKKDEWLCGYAAALGAVQRLFHENKIVVEVLKCDGLTIADLRNAGAEAFDMTAIEAAHGNKGDVRETTPQWAILSTGDQG